MKLAQVLFAPTLPRHAAVTGGTSAELNSFPALRRSFAMTCIVLAVMATAACGDDSESASDSEDGQTITSAGGSGGSNPPAVQNLAPWISGNPARQAMAGEQYSFRPGAGDPEGDPLSFQAIRLPRWAAFNTANGRITGVPTAADVGRYTNIDIEVSDGEKTSRLGSFTIDVVVTAAGTIAISWIPATQRVDGSPLTSIRGHRIHWGTSPGNYTNSALVQGQGITAYVIENLLPASYYIAASTLDTNGLESALSNAVTITVQ